MVVCSFANIVMIDCTLHHSCYHKLSSHCHSSHYLSFTNTLSLIVPTVDYIHELDCMAICAYSTLRNSQLKLLEILGYLDKKGERGCGLHVPIPVLSWDGQNILGSKDTLTRGLV